MPVAYIDHTSDLSLEEHNGTIRSLTRVARVQFFNYEVIPSDYNILTAALDVCPVPFTSLPDTGFGSMVLIERSAKVLDQERGWVDVVLKYQHILDGPNQSITPPGGTLYGKGRCSITEKTTNFYYPNGNTALPRVQIQVAHTFTNKDPDLLAQCILGPTLPWTILQGGEVSIPFPQSNYHIEGMAISVNPWTEVDLFIPCINSNFFLGRPPLTWICSEVQFEIVNVETSLYRFQFEFQYNVDTWNPTVVFLDQRTGRPPPNVLLGNIPDANGTLRLVQNPLVAAQQAGFNVQQAGSAAGVQAVDDVLNAAYGAAIPILAVGGTIAEASAAALNAATTTSNGIIAVAQAPYGGQDPIALGIPGAALGSQAAMQAGAGQANSTLPGQIADLTALFPVAGPIGGGQALSDIAVQLFLLANSAASAAGANAGVKASAIPVVTQPAGMWQVPALRQVDFNQLLSAVILR